MNPSGTIAERLRAIKSELPGEVTLIAVSKFHPVEAIMEAYAAGQRDFGESRVQELAAKSPSLPADIRWHFIGHLQTNKARQAVEHASMIQSVDSLKLLKLIDSEGCRQGKTVDILLQVHVAAEETKTGFSPQELPEAVELAKKLPAVRVRGIMGMATNTDDTDRIRADFRLLKECFEKASAMVGNPAFDTLSMGMSDDRSIAIAEGSTMVRVGTDIFGSREY